MPIIEVKRARRSTRSTLLGCLIEHRCRVSMARISRRVGVVLINFEGKMSVLAVDLKKDLARQRRLDMIWFQ
jgi:hypothetical protein